MGIDFDLTIYYYENSEDKWKKFQPKINLFYLCTEEVINTNFQRKILYKYIYYPYEFMNSLVNEDILVKYIDMYKKILQYVEYYKNDDLINHIKLKLELLNNYLYIIDCQKINNNSNNKRRIFTFEQLYKICELYRKHVDKKEIDYNFIEMVYIFKMYVELYNTQYKFVINEYD